MSTRWLPAFALVFALGCSQSLSRPDRSLAVQAPERWTAPELPAGDPDGDWWAYFGDAQLDEAVSEALLHNKSLTAAAARIDQAQAQSRIAGAAALPEVSAGFNRTRQRINFIGLPIPGREGAVLSSINTTLGPALNVAWEPDVWGKVRDAKLASTAEVQATQADLVGARLSLTGQVAKAWFSAIEANRQVQLAKAALESYAYSSDRVRARFEAGVRPSLDLRLTLTQVRNAESRLEQRRQLLDAAVRQLETLLGQYPAAQYALAEDLPECPVGVPAGLPSELVHRRPDLIAAERRLLASDARIAESKAALRPRFNLTSALGTSTNQLKNVLSGDVLIWNLVSGFTTPIFNNGRLKAAVRQDEARSLEAASTYENSLLLAYREVETALAADTYLRDQEVALDAAVRQAMAAQQLAEDRYRSGLADIITMLDSQRTALDAESALLAVRRARLDNRVDLHLALGGGFSMTVPSQVSADADEQKRKTL
ncbi:MAG: efflux transporter outer membrane subunit [Bryobacterales bacterium]|nr:efflux transporter outer membrane subunit [Bryobacterales bacterium]